MLKIAVVGGGWYGCHIALELRKLGYQVTLYESSSDIFQGISGKFGIRLHAGPHYPRSEKTRKNCQQGFVEFIKAYPELVIKQVYSLYGLGKTDAMGEPSKVDLETFKAVISENINSREVDPSEWGFENLLGAFDVDEPSIVLGNQLRKKFRTYLESAGVEIICNFQVDEISRKGDKTLVKGNGYSGIFDYAVNTTSFKSLLPSPKSGLPFDLNIIYQPCLALIYEDRLSKISHLPPFSFIVMDGWYPCIMPLVEDKKDRENFKKYIVTHGSYTIMGSFTTVEEANACLDEINGEFIQTRVQPKCEDEMKRFWPDFFAPMQDLKPRFEYVGYQSAVLAKVKTNGEFRSGLTFARDGVVYIIPGKVSNIFDAARETISLIHNQNVLSQGDYLYVKGGALHNGVGEFSAPITVRNTCDLQTFKTLKHSGDPEKEIGSTRSARTSSSDTMSILETSDGNAFLTSDYAGDPEDKMSDPRSEYMAANLIGKFSAVISPALSTNASSQVTTDPEKPDIHIGLSYSS